MFDRPAGIDAKAEPLLFPPWRATPPRSLSYDSNAHERALIIDFGSQVTQLIARRLREMGVYCEVHPYNRAEAVIKAGFNPKAIIFSGGPDSVTRDKSPARAAGRVRSRRPDPRHLLRPADDGRAAGRRGRGRPCRRIRPRRCRDQARLARCSRASGKSASAIPSG